MAVATTLKLAFFEARKTLQLECAYLLEVKVEVADIERARVSARISSRLTLFSWSKASVSSSRCSVNFETTIVIGLRVRRKVSLKLNALSTVGGEEACNARVSARWRIGFIE